MENNDLILFQGLKFDLSVSRTRPKHFGLEKSLTEVPSKFFSFLKFLDQMNRHNLLENGKNKGRWRKMERRTEMMMEENAKEDEDEVPCK